jgi:hypothetical protein
VGNDSDDAVDARSFQGRVAGGRKPLWFLGWRGERVGVAAWTNEQRVLPRFSDNVAGSLRRLSPSNARVSQI